MLAIDDEKLPPPIPASAAASSNVVNETPGSSTAAVTTHGTRSSSALTTVQLRPPKRATASVYGRRSTAPTAAGTVVSRNFCDGSKPYSGPRNSTKTDHMLQTQKPACSHRIDRMRLRRGAHPP